MDNKGVYVNKGTVVTMLTKVKGLKYKLFH